MTRKRRALKGLLILAAVLMICMFFARTVQTITTPKIEVIQATRGKLEDRIALEGEIHFAQGEGIVIPEAAGLGAVVSKVAAKQGYFVKQGDLLFTMAAGEFETQMETLKKEFRDKTRAIGDEYAGHIRLQQTSEHNDIYNAMVDAIDGYYLKRFEAFSAAKREGYLITGDVPAWGVIPLTEKEQAALQAQQKKVQDENAKKGLPPAPLPAATPMPGRDAPETVKQAMDAAFDAYLKMRQAELNMSNLYKGVGAKRVGENTFEYIKKIDGLRKDAAEIEQKMIALETKRTAIENVYAPRQGYLTQFALKAGDSYGGLQPAYSLSREGDMPSLRSDITSVEKSLKAGMKVTIQGLQRDAEIAEIVLEEGNKKYAVVPLEDSRIAELGGLSRLIANPVEMTVVYRADRTTTLIPASALRTEGDESYYVFTVEQQWGGMLSNVQYTVKKMPVTVIEKSTYLVSLTDDLSYRSIADHEDRKITDGQVVMEYVN